jgi:plastocyanin
MRKILLIAVALVFVTAACGDDDDGGSGGGAPVKLEGTVNDDGGNGEVSNGEVEMELDNFYFGPTYTKAKPGETVTISLKNEGDTTHTFTIDSLDINESLEPDATAEVEITMPESGAIRYYCEIHGDDGMQGAFYAKDGDTVAD